MKPERIFSPRKPLLFLLCFGAVFSSVATGPPHKRAAGPPPWEAANPIKPLPASPLGISSSLDQLPVPPTPQTVRLGRWLFYDKRLSKDSTISCATCHHPNNAFSERTPISTGIANRKGARKAPSIVNLAWTFYPHFFWDGRSPSLEDQAKGPIINPIEMGMDSHHELVKRLQAVRGYRPYFAEAFGDARVTIDRIAKAIADY